MQHKGAHPIPRIVEMNNGDRLPSLNHQSPNWENEIKENQISTLEETVRRRDDQVSKLQQELRDYSIRISCLESKCEHKSERILHLSRLVENRTSNEPCRGKQKHDTESLSAKLEKAECRLEQIRIHCDSIEKENMSLEERLNQSSKTLSRLQEERGKNNKLLRDLSDIVRSLNCVTISYEKEAVEVAETTALGHEVAIKNVKRKIEAMEEHRHRLLAECQQLRDDNDAKQAKIEALESYFHSINISNNNTPTKNLNEEISLSSCTDEDDHTSEHPVSIEGTDESDLLHESTIYTNQPWRQKSPIEEARSDASSDASSETSFSTLDPPQVRPEEFESLKSDYEEALQKELRLNEELSDAKLKIRALEQTASDQQEYFENENAEIQSKVATLEQQLKEQRSKMKELESLKRDNEARYLVQIDEAEKNCQSLKEQLEAVKEDFSLELGMIEAEVESSQNAFDNKYERLKTSHAGELEGLLQEYNEFKTRHTISMELQKKQFSDLELEYETLKESHEKLDEEIAILKDKSAERTGFNTKQLLDVDIQQKRYDDLDLKYKTLKETHARLEGELETTNEKYDESLRKIVLLEDQLENAKVDCEKAQNNIKCLSDDRSGPGMDELRQSTEKSRVAMEEAISQYQNLTRESHTTMSKYENEIKELRKNIAERNETHQNLMRESHTTISKYENEINELQKNIAEQNETHQNLMRESHTTISKYENEIKELQKSIAERNATHGREEAREGNETRNPKLTSYSQLQKAHEAALLKIEVLGKKLSNARRQCDERNRPGSKKVNRYVNFFEKITDPVKVLDANDEQCNGRSRASNVMVLGDEEGFISDFTNGGSTYCGLEDSHGSGKNKTESQGEKTREILFSQLFHHARLRYVHDALNKTIANKRKMEGLCSSAALQTNKEVGGKLLVAFLQHSQKLRVIHESFSGDIQASERQLRLRNDNIPKKVLAYNALKGLQSGAFLRNSNFQQVHSKEFSDIPTQVPIQAFLHHNKRMRFIHEELTKEKPEKHDNQVEIIGSKTQAASSLEMLTEIRLLHSRRFEKVQNELLHRGTQRAPIDQNSETVLFARRLFQMKKLHEIHEELGVHRRSNKYSRLPFIDFVYHLLRHHSKLHIVHYDFFNQIDSGEGAFHWDGLPASSFSSGLSYSTATLSVPPSKANDSCGTKAARNTAAAKLVIEGLRLELRRVKLAANAARIRHQAREKELRVVRFQYEKLQQDRDANMARHPQILELEQSRIDDNGNNATAVDTPPVKDVSLDEDSALPHVSSNANSFHDDLREAQLKVESKIRELQRTKEYLDETEKEQATKQTFLQNAIARFQAVNNDCAGKQQNSSVMPPIDDATVISANKGNRKGSKDNDIFRPIATSGNVESFESFDGSHLTSIDEPTMPSMISPGFLLSSPEVRDERNNTTRLHFEGVPDRLAEDAAARQVKEMQRELDAAKDSVARANEKIAARKRDLRDVIFQYKKLKGEYDDLASKDKGGRGQSENGERREGGFGDLTSELDTTKTKISVLEGELVAAKEAMEKAQRKQMEREGDLRTVIAEYKKLRVEYSVVVRNLANLKSDLEARANPGAVKTEEAEEADDKIASSRRKKSRWQKHLSNGHRVQGVSSPRSKLDNLGKKLLHLGLGGRSSSNSPTQLKIN